MSDNLIEQARVESVSFNTTDKGRTLFAKLADELARLAAEVESQRVALDNFTEMYQGLCDELNETRAELDATRGLIDEAAEARRRLGLGQSFLEYFDLYFSLLRPSSHADDARQAMFTAAMDFRASLPAKPSGPTEQASNSPREWWASVRGVPNAVDPHVGCLFTTKPESGGEVIRVREVRDAAKPSGDGNG